MKTTRRVAQLTGAASLAFCLLGGVAAPTAASGMLPHDGPVAHAPRREGQAIGVRVSLLCFVGLALGGGAYAQYRSLAALRRSDRPTMRGEFADEGEIAPSVPAARAVTDVAAAPRPRMAMPAPSPAPQLRPLPPAPPVVPLRPAQALAPRLTAAEEHCNRAFAASWRYDRRTACAAFASALASDPEVQPANLSGFWELPSSGHADLARAYLDRGQILDARSVLTFATMHFPHNRELEALVREASLPLRGERTA